MGRTIRADRVVEEHAQGCVRLGVEVEVGFVVGRPQPQGEDILLVLIPTPNSDVGPAVQQEGKDQITFDTDWLVEHALQLSSVLIGGLRVVGLYLASSQSTFANCSGLLAGLIREVSAEFKDLVAPLLLLHIDLPTGSLSCREIPTGSTSFKPVSLNVASVQQEMVTFETRYLLDAPLPTTGNPAYKESRKAALSFVSAALEGSVLATPKGDLLPPNATIGDVLPAPVEVKPAKGEQPGKRSPPLPLVSLFAPTISTSVPSHTHLQGVLTSRACVSRKESVAAARDAIVADIKAGVAARLAPGSMDEQSAELPESDEAREALAPLMLLRRVFLRLPGTALTVHEALSFREPPPRALARLQEVLGSALVVETLEFDLPMEKRHFHPRAVRRMSSNESQLQLLVYLFLVVCALFVYYWNFVRK